MTEQRKSSTPAHTNWEESLREALSNRHKGTALLREIYWASKITMPALLRSLVIVLLSTSLSLSPYWWVGKTPLAGRAGAAHALSLAICLVSYVLTLSVKPIRRALLPTTKLLPYQLQLLGRMIAAGVKCTERMSNSLAEEIVNYYLGEEWIGQTLRDIGISEEKTIRSIRKRLGHKDWQVRRDCLIALAASNYRSDEVMGDFTWLLGDAHEAVRAAAVTGIGMLGEAGEKTEALLRRGLGDPGRTVKIAAIQALAQFGFRTSDTLTILGQLAIDNDSFVRDASRELLVNSGAHEKLVVTMLVRLLGQPSLGEANVRFVAELLDTVGRSNPFVEDSLTRVLRHGATEHRRAVGRSLEFIEVRDNDLVKALVERLRDDDEECRYIAAQTLINKARTDDRFIPLVTTHLECGGPLESSIAGYVIVQTGNPYPRAIAVFRKWAASEDWEQRRDGLIALGILQPLDETIVSKICLALLDSVPEVAGAALDLLAQMPQSHVFIARALTRMMGDSRVQARRVAIETIGKVLRPRIRSLVTHLCESFNDPDESVRASAIRTIADAGVKSSKIKEALFLKLGDSSDEVRTEAFLAIESLAFSTRPAAPDAPNATMQGTAPTGSQMPPLSSDPSKEFAFRVS